MAEEVDSSGSFNSFWHRGLEKVSGKSKTMKFMPNVTMPKHGNAKAENEAGSSSGLTPKQRRRAQVRKAQIEHRQRKENYVKHLEQDVIDLREMIATTTTQAVLFKHENEAIRSALANSRIPIPLPAVAPVPPASSAPPPAIITTPEDIQIRAFAGYQQGSSTAGYGMSPEHDQLWNMLTNSNSSPSYSNSLVSVGFDEVIDATCLQISSSSTPDFDFGMGDVAMAETDFFNLGTGIVSDGTAFDPFNEAPVQSFVASSGPEPKSLSKLPAQQVVAAETDLETLGINFILALEHGCRTHFHGPAPTFDPEGAPSGHELMASTLIYSSAPLAIFSDPTFKDGPHPHFHAQPTAQHHPQAGTSQAVPGNGAQAERRLQWPVSGVTLQSLHALSTSLPKSDWEITPVQAWFKLVDYLAAQDALSGGGFGDRALMGRLKKAIAKLVGCFHFGAVMDEGAFWAVVEREVGAAGVGVGEGPGVSGSG